MPTTDFTVDVTCDEIVVVHRKHGHVYKFPILDRNTVGLRDARIAANQQAIRRAKGYLLEAYAAARAMLE
jgi:hypothetical protein